jgi:hypothetical protein
MIDPRLSEFSEAQLTLMLQSLVKQRIETEKHIEKIEMSEYIARLFEDKTKIYKQEIEDSILMETQVAHELTKKIETNKILSN